MNHVLLIGNLGKPADLRTGDSGKLTCRLSIATNDKWKDAKGRIQKITDWHVVVAFGSLAESLQVLDRGDRVAVIGRLRTRSFLKDGEKRFVTEVHAERVDFIRVNAWKGRDEDEDTEFDAAGILC